MNTASVWIGIVVFACGSYALRASGVLLRARVKLSASPRNPSIVLSWCCCSQWL